MSEIHPLMWVVVDRLRRLLPPELAPDGPAQVASTSPSTGSGRRPSGAGGAFLLPSPAMFERTALPDGPRVITARLPAARVRSPSPRTCSPGRASRRPSRPASPTSWSTSPSRAPPRTRRRARLSEAIEGVGGSFNAATDREATVYWVRVPRREAERAMDVLGELIVRPTLDRREIDREREVIIEEIRWLPRRPGGVRPDPVPAGDVRATGRWAARSAATRRASARCPRTTIREFWAGDLPARERGRRARRRHRARRGARPGRRGLRHAATARSRASSPRPRCPPGERILTGRRDTTPGAARASACRRSRATIPTRGRCRCSTRSSATG